jgi:hypothetical protein
MQEPEEVFDEAFKRAVEIGNQLVKNEKEADTDAWDVADGLLAGAIQFWLFSRQPCGDPRCEDCEPVSTSHGRMLALQQLVRKFAEESEYFHSPTDSNVGRA